MLWGLAWKRKDGRVGKRGVKTTVWTKKTNETKEYEKKHSVGRRAVEISRRVV